MFAVQFAVWRRGHWCSGTLQLALGLSLASGSAAAPAIEVAEAERTAPAIRLNTIGYPRQSPKQATVEASGDDFVVRDAPSGAEVLRGPLTPVEPDQGRAGLTIADFSELQEPGKYWLEVGDEKSAAFRISNDVYNWPFYCCVRAMYLWRCGTAVSGEFGGDHFHYDACHLDDAYLDHVGGPADQRRDGAGGWHDAGDYNKYSVNGAFTVGMMLTAWSHFADKLKSLKLDIPESGNRVPDFLDEIRWELDWLLKMQADDGRVYHKLSTLEFGGFILPDKEKERRYFSPWSSAATADFAAVMAQASRVFAPIDGEFAARCLTAAKKSHRFLQRHPEQHRPDLTAFETGPYDAPDPDDRLWAAAELWEATGEEEYLSDFEQRLISLIEERKGGSVVDSNWDWGNVGNLGLFTYLHSERAGRNPELVDRVRNDAVGAAESIMKTAGNHAYGRPLGDTYYWGCNGTVARQAMNLNVAYRLTGERRYRTAITKSLNHLFGRNLFGRSYVTGLGNRPPMNPHDRRSGGDQIKAPWPGYLVGGPWPKASDWYDLEEDYRTNEVAINWNGALIYALAAFVEPEEFEASVKAGKRKELLGSSTGR